MYIFFGVDFLSGYFGGSKVNINFSCAPRKHIVLVRPREEEKMSSLGRSTFLLKENHQLDHIPQQLR